MVRCLCCGQQARPRFTPATEDDMKKGLTWLLALGFTREELVTNPEYIESLDITTPGFVPWLRDRNAAQP